jgi:hypothetical protein
MAGSPIFKTGTVSVTNGSKIVTGDELAIWLPFDIKAGDIIKIEGQPDVYFIEERQLTNKLLLERAWEGVDGEDLTYAIVRMSGDWGATRELALAVADMIRNIELDALTTEALEAALAEVTALATAAEEAAADADLSADAAAASQTAAAASATAASTAKTAARS